MQLVTKIRQPRKRCYGPARPRPGKWCRRIYTCTANQGQPDQNVAQLCWNRDVLQFVAMYRYRMMQIVHSSLVPEFDFHEPRHDWCAKNFELNLPPETEETEEDRVGRALPFPTTDCSRVRPDNVKCSLQKSSNQIELFSLLSGAPVPSV